MESRRMHLEPKGPEAKRIEDARSLLLAYVKDNYNPGYNIKGLTPGQEGITDEFEKQKDIKSMLELAERMLGKPVPEELIRKINS
jgi:hypothetical protein